MASTKAFLPRPVDRLGITESPQKAFESLGQTRNFQQEVSYTDHRTWAIRPKIWKFIPQVAAIEEKNSWYRICWKCQ